MSNPRSQFIIILCAVTLSLPAYQQTFAQDYDYELLLRNYKGAVSPTDLSKSVSRAIGSDEIKINRIGTLVASNLLSGRSKSLHNNYFIDMFDQRCLATVRFSEWYETDALRMYGDIGGPVNGQFVIVSEKGYVTGRIYDFTSGKSYKLVPLRAENLVALVDYERDKTFSDSPRDRLGVDTSELIDSGLSAPFSDHLEETTPAFKFASVDLLILYTKKAKTPSITADIMEMVTDAQMILSNSKVWLILNPVKIQKAKFKETADETADLQRISKDKPIRKLRNRYGADLVFVITDSKYAGIAWQLNRTSKRSGKAKSQAFALVDCASGKDPKYHTFAHELGHLFGAGHSEQQKEDPGGGYSKYSHGWQWTDLSKNKYCTIMTSPDEHSRLPYYSNPDVRHDGMYTGTSKANNAKTIAKLMTYVSTYRETKNGEVGDGEVITNSIGMKLKLIEAGLFVMGSESDGTYIDEHPMHIVKITKPFYIGVYEVTQAQYEAVMGVNPSRFTGSNRPVESVLWHECVQFCNLLSEKEGVTYRLPTEAEWEYVARAGTTTEYYWGNNMDGQYAWYRDNENYETHDVGGKLPNAWELYDSYP